MAVVRAVLLLMPLWISVVYNVNMAGHVFTRPGSKARTGEMLKQTTALALLPSRRWLASDATDSVPSNTKIRRSATLPKTERQNNTGEEHARTKQEAHAKTSDRSTADGATGKNGQESRRPNRAPSSDSKTSSFMRASTVEDSSNRMEAFFSSESFKEYYHATQPSRPKEKTSGQQISIASISPFTQFTHSWPRSQPTQTSILTTSTLTDNEQYTGLTRIFRTETITGMTDPTDHWPWWKVQTEIETGSMHISSTCDEILTSCVRNGTLWCGRVDPLSCSCDVNCRVYGDCCADFAHACSSLAIAATTRLRRHSGTRLVCPAFANHLLLCSRNKNSKVEMSDCETQKWLWGHNRPWYDLKTKISYLGGNVKDTLFFSFWRAEVFFLHSDDFDLNDAEAIRRELQAMDKVVMVAYPPPGVEGRPCVPDVTRTCPLPDEKMKQACSAVTSYVQHPATSEVFANKFCLACHGLDSCETLNASALRPPDDPSTISALVVRDTIWEEVITLDLRRITVDLSSHVKWRELTCTIKKNVVKACTFLACIDNHELQDGACIHVNRSVSVLAFVHHSLSQTASTADSSLGPPGSQHRDGFLSNVFHDAIWNLASQVLFDVTSGPNEVIADPDLVWDLLVSLTFWSRLSDRQLSVIEETLTSTAFRVVRECLEERGLVGRVSLCIRVSTEQRETSCEESISFQVSEEATVQGHRPVSSSHAPLWVSLFVMFWPSLALTVLFW